MRVEDVDQVGDDLDGLLAQKQQWFCPSAFDDARFSKRCAVRTSWLRPFVVSNAQCVRSLSARHRMRRSTPYEKSQPRPQFALAPSFPRANLLQRQIFEIG